jgi:hypothetical protein
MHRSLERADREPRDHSRLLQTELAEIEQLDGAALRGRPRRQREVQATDLRGLLMKVRRRGRKGFMDRL